MYHIYMKFHTGSKTNTNWSRYLACKIRYLNTETTSFTSPVAFRVGNKNNASKFGITEVTDIYYKLSRHPKRGFWCDYEIRKAGTR